MSSGRIVSLETRAKMSLAQHKRYEDPEERAKTSAAGMGWKHTAEAREKMRLARGNEPRGGGRPANTKCALPGCDHDRSPKPSSGPWSYFCSKAHRNEHYRSTHLYQKYGLTNEEYEDVLSAQGGVCAICFGVGAATNFRPYALAVDHDHATGAVRGLLCVTCNTMLGHGREDPRILERGAAYLRNA